MDWPAWRGPHQNGVSDEVGLIDQFDPRGGPGSNVLWKSELAAGISTPIVMNGRLFTIVRDQPGTPLDGEKVICLDAATGELIWQNVYNVFLSDLPAERVGWSNVCGDPESEQVYALGACCLLQCIDAQTGKTVWARSMSEEYGMLSTYGGRTNTPIVFENLVIISGVTTGWDDQARPAHRFFAFDKSDGTLQWSTSTRPLPEDTTYSTPVIKVINGQAVMVAGSGDGSIYGIQPRTGKILWQQPLSRRGINTSVVIDHEGNVYCSHGEENPQGTAMGAVVRIDAAFASLESVSAERWRTEEITVGKSSPLLVGDRLYVVEDSSRLHVLETETGDEIGSPLKLGTAMRASLLSADGKIYACTSTGIVHILKPNAGGVESTWKVRLPKGHEIGGSPIVSHGRLYLPTSGGLFCLSTEQTPALDRTQTANAAVPQSEQDPAEHPQLAQLQLSPAETIVGPDQTVQFTVKGFNAFGQQIELPAESVSFSASRGEIDDEGRFTAPAVDSHQSAVFTATYSGVTAAARLRLIPPLPWNFDFSDEQVPVTWVGARYRHEPASDDGEPVIVKISTIPKGTRSQTWFGPSELSQYTVTADVKAKSGSNKLPDMGIIAGRYTLDLMGESQQLQIRTWAAQLRMAKSIPLQWTEGTWYTLKFQTSIQDGTAVLHGKVWPRESPEPKQWMLTATDQAPNLQGSPGLFGNATNCEFFIDNVSVQSNP
ncbi:PQQ-binding-like beta-propeller repeat protein [Stieleria sp. TO1_6]|nr:PQQ-binding-like beta-propeller repeat protein [Stieleria tagensis]MCO8125299.1 PQQ-binding-like beta-propeller repeat protein [Stieleria tagensis]